MPRKQSDATALRTSQKMWDALKSISAYIDLDKLRRTAGTDYGLDPAEAVGMAYENILSTARDAIRGTKRPVAKKLRFDKLQGRAITFSEV